MCTRNWWRLPVTGDNRYMQVMEVGLARRLLHAKELRALLQVAAMVAREDQRPGRQGHHLVLRPQRHSRRRPRRRRAEDRGRDPRPEVMRADAPTPLTSQKE
eukprot:gene61464-84075_t